MPQNLALKRKNKFIKFPENLNPLSMFVNRKHKKP